MKSLRRNAYSAFALFVAGMVATAQTSFPARVNFCDVVASPAEYNQKTLLVEVILSPGDHSLSLFGSGCVPKVGFNVTTQAVLPASLDSLPHGKKLKSILNRGREARVEVVGVFESDRGPYGPDIARFRFTISQVNAVSEAHRTTPSAGGQPYQTISYIEGSPSKTGLAWSLP